MLHRSALTHTDEMRIEPLGDSAAIMRQLEEPAYVLAERINAALPKGVIEAVASYETVGIYFDPSLTNLATLESSFAEIKDPKPKIQNPKFHVVPVCYEFG